MEYNKGPKPEKAACFSSPIQVMEFLLLIIKFMLHTEEDRMT